MQNNKKNFETLVLILLSVVLLLSLAIISIASVNAETQDTVNILSSAGGTTYPTTGTYQYSDGSSQLIAASPNGGFSFLGNFHECGIQQL
jgi:hypothetical protein